MPEYDCSVGQGGIGSMSTDWQDASWRQEYLDMKPHKPAVAKLLMEGSRGWRDAWQLGALHEDYKRLKRRQDVSHD